MRKPFGFRAPTPAGFVPIVGYEGLYSVSPDAEVFSHLSGIILKNYIGSLGYPVVSLSKRGHQITQVLVHHLVAAAFLGQRPEGMDIDHINRDRSNSKAANLRYASRSLNRQNSGRGRRKAVTPPTAFKGVIFRHYSNPKRKAWTAAVRANGKRTYTRYFSTDVEAARAYDALVISILGPDAVTNQSLGYFISNAQSMLSRDLEANLS